MIRLLVTDELLGTYPCWSRCEQRAFLGGCDPDTGRDFDYRRGWLEDLLVYQARVFANPGKLEQIRRNLSLLSWFMARWKEPTRPHCARDERLTPSPQPISGERLARISLHQEHEE